METGDKLWKEEKNSHCTFLCKIDCFILLESALKPELDFSKIWRAAIWKKKYVNVYIRSNRYTKCMLAKLTYKNGYEEKNKSKYTKFI